MNTLYYGDNLDVLRRYIADETVDLVYLDPPFKSDQSYNVLFAEQDGSRSAARESGRVAEALRAFRTFLGTSDMMAYLAMMAPRLVELRGAPETQSLTGPSGRIYQVPTRRATFQPWAGQPVPTYGRKAIIDHAGRPLFAELVVLEGLGARPRLTISAPSTEPTPTWTRGTRSLAPDYPSTRTTAPTVHDGRS